ncbi:ground-like domain protein [Teladorsagia circumcincta]|nr:ground-like domain protein [Teladorsagia circumcincta]
MSYAKPPPPPRPMGYAKPPPPPPPPSDGYVSGGGYRRHRNRRSTKLNETSSELECNNSMLKKIMKKVMTEDENESRVNISAAIQGRDGQLAVFCTPGPSKFTISSNVEFCAVKNDKLTCYAFSF